MPSHGQHTVQPAKCFAKITLRVQLGTNAEELLEQLLLDGVTIMLKDIDGSRVKIAIEAPADLQILRSEMEEQ
ncbi:carbon storage regulator [Stutzerimonas stutzeri ATCC 17588 = LMG 11199]|nr:carbon storage regulator [Stutzerimonas stutzeri ATCC 17588 = LMG 11199]